MPVPTARLLELLELLQTVPVVSGREIADRFGIDRRTVRRDVSALQAIGIPIEGERGVGGGYRLRPGYRMPPLMLGGDEAAAVVLGLGAARRLGLGDADAVDRALAKIRRVLPDRLRGRVDALEGTVAFTAPEPATVLPAGDTAMTVADAIATGRRVRLRYRSHSGADSDRELSPYGLVVHSGRWYLAAHDHGRDAVRTFRVDRVRRAEIDSRPAAAPPPGFDAVDQVSRSLARAPWPREIEVDLTMPLAEARRRIPATLAELAPLSQQGPAAPDAPDAEGCVLRMRVTSLAWAASYLAGLGCPFRVRRPDGLRDEVRALAARLTDC